MNVSHEYIVQSIAVIALLVNQPVCVHETVEPVVIEPSAFRSISVADAIQNTGYSSSSTARAS